MGYKDKETPIEERIDDLLNQMTWDEKLNEIDPDFSSIDLNKIDEETRNYCTKQLKKRAANAKVYNVLQKYAQEHTRLGIPYFIHEEGLHGVFRPGCTIFPQQLTLASTFEPKLAYDMGRGIATEARSYGFHEIFAPVLDLARDPRWGRTEETYGEDTYLSTKLGTAVVKGLQGEGLDLIPLHLS